MIERIPYPEALPTATSDYVKQNNLIETGFLRVNDPWPISGGNIVKGAVFQLGGTVYLATSDTAIGGAASNYVKLTPSGDGSSLTPTYVANLVGVSWNDTYNGYYDVGGNLYVFDEATAISDGEIAVNKTSIGYKIKTAIDILIANTTVDFAGKIARINEDNGEVEKTKIINIGDWNMDSTNNIIKAHGIADYTKIRKIDITIIADNGSRLPFVHTYAAGDGNIYVGGYWDILFSDTGNIRLIRGSNFPANHISTFDNTGFDQTSFNRGYIHLKYIE